MTNTSRAEQTYNLILKRFSVPNTPLFYENVESKPEDKPFSYLWPYSAVVSGMNALSRMPSVGKHYFDAAKKSLDALDAYYDNHSDPAGYDSYILAAGGGDKFYDDNEWLGLEFVDAYRTMKDPAYLEKAKEIWRFAISGWAEVGGIYWKQYDRSTRNTCSNGPAAVLALELYLETKGNQYLDWAKKIMDWLKPLKSPEDGVFWDHITQDGTIDKRIYTYNTGTPMHAYALLYNITQDESYLKEARDLAAASLEFFYTDHGAGLYSFPNTPWFNAVLLRGYIALYHVDPKKEMTYIQAMQKAVDYAWEHARANDGAFSHDWTGQTGVTSPTHALIDQGAMTEIYARLSQFQE